MKHVIAIALASTLCGCAHKPTMADAVVAVGKGVKVVDIAADLGSVGWEAGMVARVEHCRSQGHDTDEARSKCLGLFDKAGEVSAIFKQITVVYDTIAGGLGDLEALARQLQPYLDAARKEAR